MAEINTSPVLVVEDERDVSGTTDTVVRNETVWADYVTIGHYHNLGATVVDHLMSDEHDFEGFRAVEVASVVATQFRPPILGDNLGSYMDGARQARAQAMQDLLATSGGIQ